MIAIQHNTPVLITSDCNQRNQLRDRQAPQFFTEFADVITQKCQAATPKAGALTLLSNRLRVPQAYR